MNDPSKWADLRTRVLSAVVLAVLGIGALWSGGMAIRSIAVGAAALMIWELARLVSPAKPAIAVIAGTIAALSLGALVWFHGPYWLAALALPALFLAFSARRDRTIAVLYGLAIMLAAYGIVALREGHGLVFAIWLVLVVIASDVLGYFGGRMIGGAKFWPAVSPKKTWSGTAAGWLGAGLVGLVFALVWGQGAVLILFSALTAFAAQMGDIAESWIKRRAGVKDSSHLIPGHGGVLDRFDALIGAVVFVLAWGLAGLPMPAFGG